MVYVPAGEFIMGSNHKWDDDEKPEHIVYLDAFWIDQTEVTNAMFAQFVAATGYETDAEKHGGAWVHTSDGWTEVTGADWQHPQGPDSSLSGLDNHPVVHVSWNDARAYCEWAGRRLPTEAEWEKAARGTDRYIYPSGQWINCKQAQYYDCDGRTIPVGSLLAGASPYGALDMAGNVREWVADWYGENYYVNSPADNPPGPASGKERVVRGGSWSDPDWYVRSINRLSRNPSATEDDLGFRCARSP